MIASSRPRTDRVIVMEIPVRTRQVLVIIVDAATRLDTLEFVGGGEEAGRPRGRARNLEDLAPNAASGGATACRLRRKAGTDDAPLGDAFGCGCLRCQLDLQPQLVQAQTPSPPRKPPPASLVIRVLRGAAHARCQTGAHRLAQAFS